MPSPAAATGPYPVKLTQAIIYREATPSVGSVEEVVPLAGTVDGVNLTFDIPNSDLRNRQAVANDFDAYSDGVLDPGATFSEGTGIGGLDQIVFAVAPAVAATARVVHGQPLNLGNCQPSVQTTPVDQVAYNRGALDTPLQRPGQKIGAATFDLPVMASGLPATPPPMAEYLRCCGFQETVLGNRVRLTPLNDSLPTATLLLYLGNQYRTYRGVRGSGVFSFTAGQVGRLACSPLGTYDLPVDRGYPVGLEDPSLSEPLVELVDLIIGAAPLAATAVNFPGGFLATDLTILVNSTAGWAVNDILRFDGLGEYVKVVSINSATSVTITRGHYGTTAVALADNQAVQLMNKVCADEFTLDLGIALATELCANAEEGVKGQDITDRTMTGTFLIRATTEAQHAYWTNFTDQVAEDVAFYIGSGANGRLGFVMPRAYLTLPEDQNVRENWSLNLNYSIQPTPLEPALYLTQH